MTAPLAWLVVYTVAYVAVFVRALSVEGREPASRAAWILVLAFLPGIGMIAYLLLGEPWVGRRLRGRMGVPAARLSGALLAATPTSAIGTVPLRYRPPFRACERLSGWMVAPANRTTVTTDSNAAIRMMVADMDRARDTIHVSFYIWLADANGLAVARALERAARRGVTCRVIADGIGSRALVRSPHWRSMREAGVRLCVSLKIARGLGLLLGSRADLRNHRKIVVVDDRVTYSGSQNCADPEFRIKARFAPWVDIMLRLEGPIALQNQMLFASDWLTESGEDLLATVPAWVDIQDREARHPPETATAPGVGEGQGAAGADGEGRPVLEGVAGIAFGTGPMSPRGAMADVFVGLLYNAASEVVITTPYFVPDPTLLAALAGCARRGVRTVLVLPARNDSRVVAAISRAHYPFLVGAGVEIHEYRGGLLHAKTLVVDGTVVLVGSANMDRRSMELNFENNLLLSSPALCRQIRDRQDAWIADSDPVTRSSLRSVPQLRRLAGNLATIFGPLM